MFRLRWIAVRRIPEECTLNFELVTQDLDERCRQLASGFHTVLSPRGPQIIFVPHARVSKHVLDDSQDSGIQYGKALVFGPAQCRASPLAERVARSCQPRRVKQEQTIAARTSHSMTGVPMRGAGVANGP